MSSAHATTTRSPVTPISLGTALVLVTYVSPLAAITETAAALDAGAGGRAWVLSSMSVGLAAALLAAGVLGDEFGRRRVYLGGLVVLAAGAVGSALSPDPLVFSLARVVEGLGGAAVLACGLGLIADGTAAGPERVRATAAWGASVGLGITAGVVLAAALGGHWWASYAVVAAAALGLVPLSRSLPATTERGRRALDVTGLVTLSAALTLSVSALTEARTGLGPATLGLFAAAVVSWLGFAVAEARAAAPLVAPDLLRHPGFVSAGTGSLALGLGIIAMSSNAAGVVEAGLGRPLAAAVLPLLVWSVTSVATSLLIRRVRITWPGTAVIATALAVVGLGQLLGLGLTVTSSPWRLAPAFFVAGLATGVLNAVLGRESVASVPPERAAMGSGANNTARYLGAALGITLFSVLVGHAGSGTGPAAVVSGWNVAVAVSAALTLACAGLVGVVAVRAGRAGRSESPLKR